MDVGPIPSIVDRSRRRGTIWRGLRFILRSPFGALGTEDIVRNAETIGKLGAQIRRAPGPDTRIRTDDDRNLDIVAMAAGAGVSIAEIMRLLGNRRRQTAHAVFYYLAGGFGFLGLWLLEAVRIPVYARAAYVVGLLAICTAFFLSALYNALINWQIRTLRLGTVREFLAAEESWWPS